MKKHGYTYKDVANILSISESAVKRSFSNNELSLDRIEIIANWFSFDFFDFIAKAKSYKDISSEFTIEQEIAITEKPELLYILILFTVGYTVDEIPIKANIPLNEFNKILLLLDKIGCIELHQNNKIKLQLRGPFKILADGPLSEHLLPIFKDVVAEALRLSSSSSDLKIINECYMSKSLFTEMTQSLREVHRKYMNIAKLEQETGAPSMFYPVISSIFCGNFDGWQQACLPKT